MFIRWFLQKNRYKLDTRFSKQPMKIRILIIICLSALLSACQTFDRIVTPIAAVKELDLVNKSWNSQVESLQFANDNWLNNLNDERLEKYISIALKNNFSLQSSQAQLAAQLEYAHIAAASLYPTLGFTVNRSRSQTEQAISPDGTSQDTSVVTNTSYSGNFNASWEVDVWNRLSAEKKSSSKSAQATAADYQAARLSLVASVARAWFNLNSIKLQIDIAEKSLATIKESLEIVEEQYLNGTQSALNVYLSRSDYITQQASILELRSTLDTAIRDFKVLLGEYPDISLAFDAKLPEIVNEVPAGIPAELVMRRPDVLADFFTWQATAFDTDAAERALYPSFTLTGSFGTSSDSLSTLDEKSLLLNLVGGLTQPIFQAGKLKAQAQAARYLEFASFKSYTATLLSSFNEVETALAEEKTLNSRLALLTEVALLAESGYNLGLDQYTSGVSSYDTVLDARSRWFNAQTQVVNLKNAILQNRIALNLALGGDFNEPKQTILNRLSEENIPELVEEIANQVNQSEDSN